MAPTKASGPTWTWLPRSKGARAATGLRRTINRPKEMGRQARKKYQMSSNEQLPAALCIARILRADGQGASPKWIGHAADMLEAQYHHIESFSAIRAAGGLEAFRAMVTEAAVTPYHREIVELKAAAQPAARAPVLAWAVVHNADMALTQSAVIAQAWRKAGLEVIPLAPVATPVAVPECLTCSDHGAVGNILTAEPCPDCTAQGDAPHPPAAPWKDHQTARLVNDLRDCAIKYHSAGQLRDRIAHIAAPLCDQLKAASPAPAQDLDGARDAIRLLMAAASDAGHLLFMTVKQQKEMRDQTVASINIALAEVNKAIGGAA